MKWKRCSPSRVAGSPLLMSKISSSSFDPDWSSWTSSLRMYSGLFYVSHFQASKCIKWLKLSAVFNAFALDCLLQWGQDAFVTRLPHLVCASAEHAVWTAAEGAGRVGLFHQHWRVHPGPDPLWWRPAVHGVWKCFQGVFSLYTPAIKNSSSSRMKYLS